MNIKSMKLFILFLIINFVGLYFGSVFTTPGVLSDWYMNANKAPWTPPGWMFGVAWSTIMIFYAVYMTQLWQSVESKAFLISLYIIQWILNLIWNPLFFYLNTVVLAELVLLCLTVLLVIQLVYSSKRMKLANGFILPYILWLFIANSLNIYFIFNN